MIALKVAVVIIYSLSNNVDGISLFFANILANILVHSGLDHNAAIDAAVAMHQSW